MLGRIYTGRLPTTQANLDLINARIKKVQSDMNTLDNMVKTGSIDMRQAAYRRRQLIGEVDELKRVISNSRLSTPSYKVPMEIRGKKPAKKYVAQADSRAFFTEYNGKQPINKIPSDWQATELTELDVPAIPAQVATQSNWPSHWPGNHSPMITNDVTTAGKPSVNPSNPNYGFNVNALVADYTYEQQSKAIVSKYKMLRDKILNDMTYTPGDRTLVNQIITKLTTHLAEGEQVLAQKKAAEAEAKAAAEAAAAEPAYEGQDDTNSGDEGAAEEAPKPTELYTEADPFTLEDHTELMKNMEGYAQSVGITYTDSFLMQFNNLTQQAIQGQLTKSQLFVKLEELTGPINNGQGEGTLWVRANGGLNGMRLPALLGRRRGNVMALGAMQGQDKFRNLTPKQRAITNSQRQSYLAAERELTLAKARAGAKVDVTQELKNQPVTRPWSLQVTVTAPEIQQLSLMLDANLSQVGLSQDMLTQQAHNYIAHLINSLDSSLQPADRIEFVVEKIMAQMVNRSAMLKDNVRVDIKRSGQNPLTIAPTETTSVDGLGSVFLKTKAAMGRLLR
jgi:hypothetical protein